MALALVLAGGAILQPQALGRTARKMADTGVLRVYHLGDSHVQGASFPAEFRRLLQEERGDAGRGLAFAHRLAGTNGSLDFAWAGSGPWAASNNLRRENPMPWGISGWSIASLDSSREIVMTQNPKADPPRKFVSTRALLFGQGVRLSGMGAADSCGPSCLSYAFPATDTFRISLDSMPGRFDGLMLENGRPGVVWAEAGVNGLAWADLSRPSRMWEQLRAWDPDMVVVSLGTNDAYAKGYSASDFGAAVREGLRRLRLSAPRADIVLSLPPDHALKVRRRKWTDNPRLPSAEAVLREECRRAGVACLELRALMGGPGAWKEWLARGTMGPDHVHYRVDGYREQARLMVGALREGWKSARDSSWPEPAENREETSKFLAAQDSILSAKSWSEAKPVAKPKAKKRPTKFRRFHHFRRAR